jgi:hypothetical protein
MADVNIYRLPFKCVKLSEADFSDFAAIYVILCVDKGGNSKVIDVGQSGEVGTRINSHDRANCWKKNCQTGNIWVCLYKTPSTSYTKDQRTALEGEIRKYYNPDCGKL